jgi:hypothetical protein
MMKNTKLPTIKSPRAVSAPTFKKQKMAGM